jgi:two-component system sensor histidine kinase DesK
VVEHERHRPARRSTAWPVAGAALAVLVFLLVATGGEGPVTVVLPTAIAVTAAGVAAWAVHRTRADRAAYEARLTRWAASEAVLAERLRIARDLHDIVSHGLGLITVRVAAARLTAADPREPPAGPPAGPPADVLAGPPADVLADVLADVEAASREATAELRRMLTVLRSADDTAPRLPVDSLDQLPAIVAGTGASLRLEPVGEVSPGVQVAVCRTVREALTNVARHVGPSTVRVHVYRDHGTVVAAVSDTGPQGPWPAAPGAGHGLLGLHERISALGGSLHAEPAGPGFRVTARIPDTAAP